MWHMKKAKTPTAVSTTKVASTQMSTSHVRANTPKSTTGGITESGSVVGDQVEISFEAEVVNEQNPYFQPDEDDLDSPVNIPQELLVGGSLALAWHGNTWCQKFWNFAFQYYFLSFRSAVNEMEWHQSTVRGKMLFVRLCCAARILMDVGLLIGVLLAWPEQPDEPSVSIVGGPCIMMWARVSYGLGLAIQVVAFGGTFLPWMQRHWQWVSAGFVALSIVAVQLFPLCASCESLLEAYALAASNETQSFCSVYFDESSNFTIKDCAAAQRAVIACVQNADDYRTGTLLFTVFAAMFGPPLRVLCVGNVINLAITFYYMFGGYGTTIRAVCSGVGCFGFGLQMVTLYFVIHLMFWLIEVNSRGGWTIAKALTRQNLRLDRLANPFSPDAFRTWLEGKRRRRKDAHQRSSDSQRKSASSSSSSSSSSAAATTGHHHLLGDDKSGVTWDLDMSNFEIEERPFAAGSSGRLFRGKYKGQQVAIKELYGLMRMADSASYLETGAELTVLSQLRHPNVLTWYGVVYMQAADSVGIVTEFCEGGSLEAWLSSTECQTASFAALLEKALQIASGMRYLHEDVRLVHRDLKPANILLATGTGICKLCDFGLSGANVASGDDSRPANVATPEFMSPEFFTQQVNDFQKVDTYAFAIVLWQLLSRGALPFGDTRGYQNLKNAVVKRGERPDLSLIDVPTPNVKEKLFQLIQTMWQDHASARPSFVGIVDILAPMLAVEQMKDA